MTAVAGRTVRVAVADSHLWHLVDDQDAAYCGAEIRNLHSIRTHDTIAQALKAVPTDSAIHICSQCITRHRTA